MTATMNVTNTSSTETIPILCWCGTTDGASSENTTLDNGTGNLTQSIERTSRSSSTLFINNWVVVLLISGTVLAFIAGLFIKRQQLIKDRQRREEQYLAYFHSILPHSRLYGKIETPEDGSGNGSNKNSKSKSKSKSKEKNKYSTQHGLKKIWENIGSLDASNEDITDTTTIEAVKDRSKSVKDKKKVLDKIEEGSETSPCIENEMSSGIISTAKLEIEILHESDVHQEQRKSLNVSDAKDSFEMRVLQDMSETGGKDTDIEMNSKFHTTNDIQDSSCVVWI